MIQGPSEGVTRRAFVIGTAVSLFVGLGVILVSRTPAYTGTITNILFGDALGISTSDVVSSAVVASVALVASVLLYRPFLVLAFSEQKARLLGLLPGLAHALLLALITVTIVGSFQTVGTLLVLGLLVGPPATAALLVRRVPTIMATAVLIGVISVGTGLIISFHANTSGSATIAVMPISLFFIALTVRSIVSRLRRHSVSTQSKT